MASKCVHKSCGKTFTDPDEPCIYHPGPPEFHEGQKGWKCCKPRVLTFDEFLEIPPCTTGKHSTVDDTPAPPPKASIPDNAPTPKPIATSTSANGVSSVSGLPTRPTASTATARAASPAPPPPEDEEDSDDPDTTPPPNAACKRKTCGKSYDSSIARDDEECIYHPGRPLFHEGSKGWTCCKRRVLEFDEFMKIEGCKKRKRHMYVGKKAKQKSADEAEKVESVRHDFYQTSNSVICSFYLKKIDKSRAKIEFQDDGETMMLDLPTSDGKRYTATYPLWGRVEPEKCQTKIMGTKLEVILVKKAGEEGRGWPTLRSDERSTGEIIQTGRAGRA